MSRDKIEGKRSPRPHERLDVWQVSMALALEVYRATKSFPKEELYGITSQLRRAAASVPANIAEGCARRGAAEKRQFCCVARGSLSELETFLALSNRLEYLPTNTYGDLMSVCGRVGAMLNGLIKE